MNHFKVAFGKSLFVFSDLSICCICPLNLKAPGFPDAYYRQQDCNMALLYTESLAERFSLHLSQFFSAFQVPVTCILDTWEEFTGHLLEYNFIPQSEKTQ